jgi:hypothetical protein
MGQAGNSKRHASLDEQKERAAGRRNNRELLKQAVDPGDMKGRTGGAFGAQGRANKGPQRTSRPARRRKA